MRPIRNENDYRAALARIEELMTAAPGTPDADELEVLATLVDVYEREHFPIEAPTAVEAIKFRMDQTGLTARDLEPYLGSRAKVSEILSGTRPLTLQMIRALTKNLGIPAEVLLQQPGAVLPEAPQGIEWQRFPLLAMAKLGWIEKTKDLKDRAEEIMRDLISRAGGAELALQPLYRKNDAARQNARTDMYALRAWCYQLLANARAKKLPKQFTEGSVSSGFVNQLVRLSWSTDGPKLAREYLNAHGIHLLVLPHLPRTHLDGSILRLPNGTPVIGLTLRYDRLDNFWFSLCHELAHLALHMAQGEKTGFVDDFTVPNRGDQLEKEADRWAEEALIPSAEWSKSAARLTPTPANVVHLAHTLGIHPAIVAGRVRKESRNYRLLTHFVGIDEVSRHFSSTSTQLRSA
jgi:HTH-type transcriptional regulator/antitoxin HigA